MGGGGCCCLVRFKDQRQDLEPSSDVLWPVVVRLKLQWCSRLRGRPNSGLSVEMASTHISEFSPALFGQDGPHLANATNLRLNLRRTGARTLAARLVQPKVGNAPAGTSCKLPLSFFPHGETMSFSGHSQTSGRICHTTDCYTRVYCITTSIYA